MTRVSEKRERPEHDEQSALFSHMERYLEQYPMLDSIFAVPNGEYRPPSVGARLKAEGVKAGVLDICVPVPRSISVFDYYPGMWVEMKAPGKLVGKELGTSAEQRAWATIFTELGWKVALVDNWQSAWEEIKRYLGIDLKEDWI